MLGTVLGAGQYSGCRAGLKDRWAESVTCGLPDMGGVIIANVVNECSVRAV